MSLKDLSYKKIIIFGFAGIVIITVGTLIFVDTQRNDMQSQFASKVAENSTQAQSQQSETGNKVAQEKIQEAIKNNDFTSFKSIAEEQMKDVEIPDFMKEQLESRMEDEFDKMVKEYEETGELPDMSQRGNGMNSFF